MATHVISFRIASGPDYDKRWASVVSAIKSQTSDGLTWEETTSFVLIRSAKSAQDLARAIYLGSDFSNSRDTLLVVDVDRKEHATQGLINYPSTLASFFNLNALGGFLGLRA
jgi:hypothetical protein